MIFQKIIYFFEHMHTSAEMYESVKKNIENGMLQYTLLNDRIRIT